LIYVFATHVNRSENRKIDWFTASHKRVDAQKLSRVFVMYICMMYMSCSVCAKTLLSFCVYEQRLCRVFAMYVIAMCVNWFENGKNQLICCITQVCRCAKAESCLYNIYVCDVYELQHVRKDIAVVLCIWAKIVSCLCNVCICNACKLIRKLKINRFTVLHQYVYAQKLSHVFAITVWMSYISCNICIKTLLLFCVYEQRLCCIFAVYVIMMHVHWSDKAKNQLIYCIMQTCRCTKAELCLCNICMYIIYEFNVWIKRC